MAFIGMRHVVACELDSHTAGSEPTYETAAGFDVGMAITGNLTINRNSNPLRADDTIAEDDNGITSMSLELGVDDVTDANMAKLGLLKETSVVDTATSTTVYTYYDTSAAGKYVGVGYSRTRRKNGATTYQGIWIYKVLFSLNSENSQTKGENIEWQTPTLNGNCLGLDIDSSGDVTYRKIRNFTTEAACDAWLDAQANITRT